LKILHNTKIETSIAHREIRDSGPARDGKKWGEIAEEEVAPNGLSTEQKCTLIVAQIRVQSAGHSFMAFGCLHN